MKVEEFTRKDGTTGESYYPEAGDKFVAVADKVFEREVLGVRKADNKPFKSMKYGLSVTTVEKPSEEIFLNLTEGQKKGLSKAGSLSGKNIVFYEYENAYGKQVGCKAE